MDTIYDLELRKILTKEAKVNNIVLKEGVYLQTTGPAYESPAEVKMFGMFGADAVGMSTQEVKHSAFLAWLLDPNKPHGLGNAVLKLLLEKVRAYPAINRIPSNAEIIAKISEDFSDS